MEQAADRATAVMQGALADLELQLTSSSLSTSAPPAGVVIVIGGPTAVIDVVRPDGGLLVYPKIEQVPELPATLFAAAEQAEFARRDLVAAGNLYAALASGADTADTVVTGALAGLARVRRKGQQPDAALAAYAALAELSGARVAGLPVELVALTGRARVLEDTGFKTPTLREIERTAPYMHDGSIATLDEVVEFYDRSGNANPFRDRELRPLRLTEDEKSALVAFRSLTGTVSDGLWLCEPQVNEMVPRRSRRQEGFSAAPLHSKSGSRQDLAVFQFDAVVERQPQPSS